ncbi:hypothetical protein Tco_0633107 [Tanacetum coccineum]
MLFVVVVSVVIPTLSPRPNLFLESLLKEGANENHRGREDTKGKDANKEGRMDGKLITVAERDDRKYSQVVRGMKKGAYDGNDKGNMGTKKTEHDNNKNEMSHGVADEKKQTSEMNCVIDVMEADIDKDTLSRAS